MSLKMLKKCVVDTDNIFSFLGVRYIIPVKTPEYTVYKKYDKEADDFENLSEMWYVEVAVDTSDNKLQFLNQKGKKIDGVKALP